MTEWIIRRFVPNARALEQATVRTRYGHVASMVGIVCNVLLFLFKLVTGLLSQSVAIIADATNNLSDFASSIVSLIGFRLASRPSDEDHPYGHGRYEYLAGLFVAVLIMVIGVEIFKNSVGRILDPTPVDYTPAALIVLIASIGLKLWLMVFYRAIGRRINSQTILATSADSRNDVISTGTVLLGALLTRVTGFELDAWMGLLVAIFILVNGFGIIRDTIDPLLGLAPDKAMVDSVRTGIMNYPGVLGTHDLMIHDYGPAKIFASVHVELDAGLSGLEAHEITDQIERDFYDRDGIHMTVHYDPVLTQVEPALEADPEIYAGPEATAARIAALRQWLNDEVGHIHPELSIHDLSVIPGNRETKLVFDLLKPDAVTQSDEELMIMIRERIRRINPAYRSVIRVESFAPTLKDA